MNHPPPAPWKFAGGGVNHPAEVGHLAKEMNSVVKTGEIGGVENNTTHLPWKSDNRIWPWVGAG
ncbi:protein of unknown function [Kyrpidia spormannii]|uniref:Uncharacterized protein n=2 Tax=Kyrpidia spormannii TaxID=2055160 RepID=A0ACA8Z624_9BACL|nr:protein of unknown function [Kyrpidia spormannii]CAB3391091.1 protein of unknown function [Kyrpidia spormannii]